MVYEARVNPLYTCIRSGCTTSKVIFCPLKSGCVGSSVTVIRTTPSHSWTSSSTSSDFGTTVVGMVCGVGRSGGDFAAAARRIQSDKLLWRAFVGPFPAVDNVKAECDCHFAGVSMWKGLLGGAATVRFEGITRRSQSQRQSNMPGWACGMTLRPSRIS